MLTKLKQLIESTNPKQLSQFIKRDLDLYNWVSTRYGKTISEKAYNALHPNSNQCPNGNQKKFKSILLGYGFCGKTGGCQCAKQSVSKSVTLTKNSYTTEQKQQITEKRVNTTLKKYGVTNVGQTVLAKQRHTDFYKDSSNIDQAVLKVKSTKLKKYNDANYNNPDKIKQTFREKRDDGFWQTRYPDKKIKELEDRNCLEQMYKKFTPVEIADQLHVHVQTVYRYLNNHKLKEPFKSIPEQEVVNFLTEIGITNIVRNSRKILPSRKELDIFLPEYNIAIEYNGVYWHHEDVAYITRDYHYNKYKECSDLGIQLITIFSTFWDSKKDIVKNILEYKLKKCNTKLYARQCTVVEVSTAKAKEFFDAHHIQGYTPATTRLGLVYNGNFVAMMTFSKSRIAMGKVKEHTELVRFATHGQVTGAASKLLSAYRKQFPNESIVSYSDNEWSDGSVYSALGFELECAIKPSYWYLKPRDNRLYHRFTFSKQKLVKHGHDPLLTEAIIAKNIGLLKVWDCGKQKWILR